MDELSASARTRDALWALAAAVLALAAALPAVAVGIAAAHAGVPHVLYLGLAAASWPAFGAAAALAVARLIRVPLARPHRRSVVAVVALGALAAAAAEWGVVSWSYLKFGRMETEMIGLTLLMPMPLALLTATTSAWLLTRGLARRLSGVGLAVSVALLGVIAVLDARGLSDGVEEWSWPLAAAYAAVSGFVALVLATVWLTWRTRRDAHPAARR